MSSETPKPVTGIFGHIVDFVKSASADQLIRLLLVIVLVIAFVQIYKREERCEQKHRELVEYHEKKIEHLLELRESERIKTQETFANLTAAINRLASK